MTKPKKPKKFDTYGTKMTLYNIYNRIMLELLGFVFDDERIGKWENPQTKEGQQVMVDTFLDQYKPLRERDNEQKQKQS